MEKLMFKLMLSLNLFLSVSLTAYGATECENKLNNAIDAQKEAISVFNHGSEIYSHIDLFDGNLVKQCIEYKKSADSIVESENYFQTASELFSKISPECEKEIVEAATLKKAQCDHTISYINNDFNMIQVYNESCLPILKKENQVK